MSFFIFHKIKRGEFKLARNKGVEKTFDIEKDILLTNLVEIPAVDYIGLGLSELIINDDSKSETLKAFRNLKTNIQFLNVNNKEEKTILVTSPYKQEGKSYVTANLAIAYSEIGKKVLIIDGDLKNGRQAEIFNIPNVLGFSNLLSGLDNDGLEMDTSVNKFIKDTSIKNISLITSGIVPPNSAELLSSKKFPDIIKELSSIYDIILIDGTSILLYEDSLILSRRVGSTIIVSDGNTKKDELIQTKKDIQNVGGRIIGVVSNKVGFVPNKSKSIFKKLINKVTSFINNIINKIKEEVKNKKQKLLEEGKEDITSTEVKIKKETPRIETKLEENNKKINEIKEDKQNEKTVINDDKEKIDNIYNQEIKKGKNKKTKKVNLNKETSEIPSIIKEKHLEPEVDNTSTNINTKESQVNANVIDESNVENNLIDEEKDIIKPAIILKALKHKIMGRPNSNEKKEPKKEKNTSITETINYEVPIDYNGSNEYNEPKNKEIVDSNVEVDEKTVLVIVDGLNGVCRAFNKDCYTEKLARGLDRSDGFVKAHYSPYFMSKRVEGLMSLYNISKKQAKRIDPLVYETLCDFDECIWLEKKIDSDLAGIYVKCMTIEFEKMPSESLNKYANRCKKLRKEALKKLNIEIEYSLNNGFKASNLRIIDKIEMKKFSGLLEIKEEKNSNINNNVRENNTSLNSNQEENIEEAIKREKESLINKQKKYEERQDEKKRKKELRDEKKKETEILRKIKKEKQNVKRREQKTKREMEKEEKNRLREEIRIQREAEREKQKEEARIEEELLVDNLYPKTKNNKDL